MWTCASLLLHIYLIKVLLNIFLAWELKIWWLHTCWIILLFILLLILWIVWKIVLNIHIWCVFLSHRWDIRRKLWYSWQRWFISIVNIHDFTCCILMASWAILVFKFELELSLIWFPLHNSCFSLLVGSSIWYVFLILLVSPTAKTRLSRTILLFYSFEEYWCLRIWVIFLIGTQIKVTALLFLMISHFSRSCQIIENDSGTCPIVRREMAAVNSMIPRQRIRWLWPLNKMHRLSLCFQFFCNAH